MSQTVAIVIITDKNRDNVFSTYMNFYVIYLFVLQNLEGAIRHARYQVGMPRIPLS